MQINDKKLQNFDTQNGLSLIIKAFILHQK